MDEWLCSSHILFTKPVGDPWSDSFSPFIRDTAVNKTDMIMTLRKLLFLLGIILHYC